MWQNILVSSLLFYCIWIRYVSFVFSRKVKVYKTGHCCTLQRIFHALHLGSLGPQSTCIVGVPGHNFVTMRKCSVYSQTFNRIWQTDIHTSWGSAVTCLRCGTEYHMHFNKNLTFFPEINKLWKSLKSPSRICDLSGQTKHILHMLLCRSIQSNS